MIPETIVRDVNSVEDNKNIDTIKRIAHAQHADTQLANFTNC